MPPCPLAICCSEICRPEVHHGIEMVPLNGRARLQATTTATRTLGAQSQVWRRRGEVRHERSFMCGSLSAHRNLFKSRGSNVLCHPLPMPEVKIDFDAINRARIAAGAKPIPTGDPVGAASDAETDPDDNSTVEKRQAKAGDNGRNSRTRSGARPTLTLGRKPSRSSATPRCAMQNFLLQLASRHSPTMTRIRIWPLG